ncbi:hypothetical protein SODALDRAFT_325767 [Sodiomyces alkalinus F11]|uniref:Uncharacterized protein n=1 Tax=Sodiomyces alkalinus (strain CBS 110278 / VKM F-3762 / F11) TaxID=1314773 RepID=A0A3N2PPJ3_SODAK|nr:hypothetical protein SODALDRAFT_325767 [Sodiomyces alkalinus F11]ROT36432.1 hypothetical protein SODALDRAFT_325767 [Sodiomyces alkalinus F11]
MVREGTRSQTGNSRPRIFPAVESAPAAVRKRTSQATTKTKKTAEDPVPKAAKPTGVTKSKAKVTKGPKKAKTETGNKGAPKTAKVGGGHEANVDNCCSVNGSMFWEL